MPGTSTAHNNLPSLLSVEVLVSDVQVDLPVQCHLPCIVFRLLDYPAVSIPYFDQWQVEEFHSLKKEHPHLSWPQLLSDQFYELRSANGKFAFKRGKSCLFKTYFQTLYAHLLNVPLFLLLIDQINDSNPNTSHFLGSCNVKLNELIEVLHQSINRNGNDVPLVEQQTFHCTLFNLMGTRIGSCDIAVRFCHYGTTILTQLPALDDGLLTKTDKKVTTVSKPSTAESATVSHPSQPPADTIVKHIHFVNEKKDVGLQLSHRDLPSSASNTKSIQTRWTSTLTHTRTNQPGRNHFSRTIEDPSWDDPTIALYRPPALYFNSDSDFLQITAPSTTKILNRAKEHRLSYLASIPIASFDGEANAEDDDADRREERSSPARKPATPVRLNLLSSSPSSLAKDFLQHFPLLRSLVEEALALQQQHHCHIPLSAEQIIVSARPCSAAEQHQRPTKQLPTRPKSASRVRSMSVIIPRGLNRPRRLHPPPSKTKPTAVMKPDVRSVVDRLSKQRETVSDNINKPVERPLVTASPRGPTKPTAATFSTSTGEKPPPSYTITRAHRLMIEFSRARRAGFHPQATSSPKSQVVTPKKETAPIIRTAPSTPQILNTGTLSQGSLLNKVEIDTITVAKNASPLSPIEKTVESLHRTLKSISTTSEDVTQRMNQTLLKTISSDANLKTPEKGDDLAFSITDITDYFTDGGESSTRPPTRQST